MTVSNITTDPTSPIVSITAPANGSTVSGSVTVSASATDNVGVAGVQFKLDGANLGTEDTTSPYSITWSTNSSSNGTHTLTAVARDAAGNTTLSAGTTVTVNNVTTGTNDEIHYSIMGQNAVTFDWRGPANTISYGTVSGTYQNTVTGVTPSIVPYSSAGPFWEARLVGLQENTKYYYKIGTNGEQWFRTPIPRGTSNFSIMTEADVGDATYYANMGPVQRQIASDIPAFVLLPGDISYANNHGQVAADRHYNDVMVWSQVAAYMPAWGNHEWDSSGDNLRNYKGRHDLPNQQTSPGSPSVSCCGEDWYWFDYGNVRFIAYPEPWSGAWSDWNTKARALMDSAQADPAITFIVTFGHRPAYSSGHHPGSSTLKGYLDALGTSHSKYVLNLNGHSHNYERTTPQSGVTHLTVGTGGAGLEQDNGGSACGGIWLACPTPSYTAVRYMRQGVTKLTFSPTSISGQFLCGPSGGGTNDISCTVGQVIDSFTIGTPPVLGGDTQPPAVSLTAPASGATVSGSSAAVSGAATDNVGVAGVQFKLDGANLGTEDTTSPYSITWSTTGTSNGNHILSAAARDAAGNATLSSGVSVTVDNPVATFGSIRSKRVGLDDTTATAPVTITWIDALAPVSTNPADFASITTGSHTVSATDVSGYAETAGICTYPIGGTECTLSTFPIIPACSGASCSVPVAVSQNVVTKVVVKYLVTTTGGGGSLITNPNTGFSLAVAPKPAYLSPVLDPTFLTTVTRIANNPSLSMSWAGPPSGSGTWGSDARQHYQKDQPWNSDSSIIALQNQSGGSPNVVYLDGTTYQPKYGQCSGFSPGDDRWNPSPSHPHERIAVSGGTLRWYDVVVCSQTRTWSLPFSVDYFGSGEGNPSSDGRFVALADATRMFVVDMDPQAPFASYASGNRRIGPAVSISGCGLSDCSVDWVSISPSGKYAVVSYNGDHPRVYDVNPDTLALTSRPMPTASPECSGHDPLQGYIFDLGHADMTINPADGKDVIVGQRRSWCPSTVGGVPQGSVQMVRLEDNLLTSLTNPSNEASSHHISARNYNRPGWIYVGYYPDSGKRFADEIVAINIGTKAVERFAQKHSATSGCYRCETHAVPSPDGMRVLWASNWALNCGTGCGSSSDIKAYVVDSRPLR